MKCFILLTKNLIKCIFFLYIPRLCNGSTSDSGSDCGGSNPPWGKKADLTVSFFYVYKKCLFHGPFVYRLGRDPLKVERRVRFP